MCPLRRAFFLSWTDYQKISAMVQYVYMAAAPAKKPKGKKPVAPSPARRGRRALFGGPSFFGSLTTTILIFLLLMSAYSLIACFVQPSNDVPLSVVAADVAAGKVKE